LPGDRSCASTSSVRKSDHGPIERIDSLFINLAKQKIEGVDIEMSYRRGIDGSEADPRALRCGCCNPFARELDPNRGGARMSRWADKWRRCCPKTRFLAIVTC
jgi:hypothetical protein